MSAAIKLAGKLPGNVLVNGLDRIAEELVARWEKEDPRNPAAVLVIGIVRVRKVEHLPTDDGRVFVPTMEIARIEPLGVVGQDALNSLGVVTAADQKRLLEVSEGRTGEVLPLDAESAAEAGIEVVS
jgi:hypothetical protein